MICWNIFLFVYYEDSRTLTWASSRLIRLEPKKYCKLVSSTSLLTEDACRVYANHEAIEGSAEEPARRCGEDRSPPSPATSCGWTGSLAGCPPLPLHFAHHITPRPHHSMSSTFRLEQMLLWEPRRPTVVMSLGAYTVHALPIVRLPGFRQTTSFGDQRSKQTSRR